MVELASAPYDHDGIPLVPASVVSIDAELDAEYMVTAQVVPASPISSISEGNSPPGRVSSISSASENSHSFTYDENEQVQHESMSMAAIEERKRTYGAGAAGAVIGLFFGGPIVSLIFGIGGLYYARKQGATGDVARAIGDVALVAREKWMEVDSKHHIVEKSKAAAKDAIHKLKESDRKHRLKRKIFKTVRYCWNGILDYVERHQLVDRGVQKLQKLADAVSERRIENEREDSLRRRNVPC